MGKQEAVSGVVVHSTMADDPEKGWGKIMPEGGGDVWFGMNAAQGVIFEKGDLMTLTMLGCLKHGIAAKHAQAELAIIAASLGTQYPETNKSRSVAVQTVLRYRTAGGGGRQGNIRGADAGGAGVTMLAAYIPARRVVGGPECGIKM